jgi:hypothetical protein
MDFAYRRENPFEKEGRNQKYADAECPQCRQTDEERDQHDRAQREVDRPRAGTRHRSRQPQVELYAFRSGDGAQRVEARLHERHRASRRHRGAGGAHCSKNMSR